MIPQVVASERGRAKPEMWQRIIRVVGPDDKFGIRIAEPAGKRAVAVESLRRNPMDIEETGT